MYTNSTQNKFWIFKTEEDLEQHKAAAWTKYVEQISDNFKPEQIPSIRDQQKIVDHYGCFIRDLCNQFQAPPPPSVYGTAAIYFKRFYLNTSPLKYHPKEVAYLCIYLAAKVDEYNVSIGQFMQQLAPDYEQVQDFIISNELLLMQKLHFHLSVHNAFRPLEGFLIDMKTRFEELGDVEKYRPNAEKFIGKALLADIFLLYPPTQVALAALKASIGKIMDHYVQKVIGDGSDMSKLLVKLEEIINIVKTFKLPGKEEIDALESKFESCRNQEHNPLSEQYRATEKLAKEKKEKAKEKIYNDDLKNRSEQDEFPDIEMMMDE